MKQYHVEITYQNGEIQDEWFARKSGQIDYVDYIHRMCPLAKIRTYTKEQEEIRISTEVIE